MENEKLDLILNLVQGMNTEQKAMREDMTVIRSDLTRLADAVEVLAREQAAMREDLDYMGRRVSRLEQNALDQTGRIETLAQRIGH
ncbi:hypothetical protein AB4Y36_38195 [Paraburkholderia sp. BR10936]|uniref:hypothetical protein n=1 Tax=Paraburkholderia sp. BR10936 TaxID=3236993 RepID=UPI0034D1E92E